MRRSTKRKVLVALLLFVCGGAGAWLWLCDPGEPDATDLEVNPENRSKDLEQDRKLMWETRDGRSTEDALRPASRVFNTIELIGLTRDEVLAQLGDPRATGTPQHSIPWFDAGWRDLVYRFDNGAYGTQYNIKFDWRGRVRRVQSLGIE
jgi:hypothetical protein